MFSPNGVELENRRELFNYIVLGEENVAKVAEVKKLNDLINGDLKTKIDDAETKLKKAAIIQDIKILDSASELDDNTLKTMRSSVEENNKIITHAERITKEKKLENITDFENISFAEVISADLSSLSLAADYKTHVQIHNEWIKDGMEILKSEAKESCPFCFQAVKNNSAIATYKTLFSEEYETLRKKVGDQILSTDRTYSEAAVKNVIDLINRNSERCAFWHKLDKKIPESLALDISLEEVVGIFKNTLKNLLERKKDNLLEAISSNENEREGLSNENKFREAIAKYNLLIAEFNTFIQVVKDASRDIEELKLKNANNHINVVCNDVGYRDEKTSKIYKTLKEYRKQKKDAETQIKLLREEIDQASLKVLEDYEQSINRELENFGVEFSIKGIKKKLMR